MSTTLSDADIERYKMDPEGKWAVVDGDRAVLPGRWASEERAREHGLGGKYLFSGMSVVLIEDHPTPPPRNRLSAPALLGIALAIEGTQHTLEGIESALVSESREGSDSVVFKVRTAIGLLRQANSDLEHEAMMPSRHAERGC